MKELPAREIFQLYPDLQKLYESSDLVREATAITFRILNAFTENRIYITIEQAICVTKGMSDTSSKILAKRKGPRKYTNSNRGITAS